MIQTHPDVESILTRPRLLPLLKGIAALFATLVLVQAFLAGRGWFVDFDQLTSIESLARSRC